MQPLNTKISNVNQTTQILGIYEVCNLTTLSRSTIFRMIKFGEFPHPVQLSKSRSGFLSSDIQDWIKARPKGASISAMTKADPSTLSNEDTSPVSTLMSSDDCVPTNSTLMSVDGDDRTATTKRIVNTDRCTGGE